MWMVNNIKGSDSASGDTTVPFMVPEPVHGKQHRLVMLLLRQGDTK